MEKQALKYREDMMAAIYYQMFVDEINYVKKKEQNPNSKLLKKGEIHQNINSLASWTLGIK